jgi:hypothetical protein
MSIDKDLLFKDWVKDRNEDFISRFDEGEAEVNWKDEIEEGHGYSSYIYGTLTGASVEDLARKAYSIASTRLSSLGLNGYKLRLSAQGLNYACGKDIVVSTKVLEDTTMKPTERIDVLLGEVVHEAAHALYTDDKVWVQAIRSKSANHSKPNAIFQAIFNIIEDEYIEREIGKDYPGYSNYILAVKNEILGKTAITRLAGSEEPLQEIMNAFLLFVRYPKHIKDSTVDKYGDLLMDIRNLFGPEYPESTRECAKLAFKVYDLMKSYYESHEDLKPKPPKEITIQCDPDSPEGKDDSLNDLIDENTVVTLEGTKYADEDGDDDALSKAKDVIDNREIIERPEEKEENEKPEKEEGEDKEGEDGEGEDGEGDNDDAGSSSSDSSSDESSEDDGEVSDDSEGSTSSSTDSEDGTGDQGEPGGESEEPEQESGGEAGDMGDSGEDSSSGVDEDLPEDRDTGDGADDVCESSKDGDAEDRSGAGGEEDDAGEDRDTSSSSDDDNGSGELGESDPDSIEDEDTSRGSSRDDGEGSEGSESEDEDGENETKESSESDTGDDKEDSDGEDFEGLLEDEEADSPFEDDNGENSDSDGEDWDDGHGLSEDDHDDDSESLEDDEERKPSRSFGDEGNPDPKESEDSEDGTEDDFGDTSDTSTGTEALPSTDPDSEDGLDEVENKEGADERELGEETVEELEPRDFDGDAKEVMEELNKEIDSSLASNSTKTHDKAESLDEEVILNIEGDTLDSPGKEDITFIPMNSGDHIKYGVIRKRVKPFAKTLATQLNFDTFVKNQVLLGLRNGTLDEGKIVEASMGIATVHTRTIEGKAKGGILGILLDESGSMCSRESNGMCRYEIAQELGVLFHETLSQTTLDYSIYGHTADGIMIEGKDKTFNLSQLGKTYILIYKEGKTKLPKYNLSNVNARSNNRDGDAIYAVAKRMRANSKDKSEPIYLIVISDGLPMACNYSDGVRHTNKMVKAAATDFGVTVIGVGVHVSYSMSQIYGDNHVNFQNMKTFVKDTGKLIRKIVKLNYKK